MNNSIYGKYPTWDKKKLKKGAVKYTAPFLKVQGYSFNSK